MSYRIKKLFIQNFKTFNFNDGKLYEINFNENVTILTGPNGYGKTTIFDAIELVLTGNLNRIHNVSGNSKLIDNLFANDDTRDVDIGMELFDKENNKHLSLLKHIPKNKIKNARENTIEEWFENYIIKDKFDKQKLLASTKLSLSGYSRIINEELGLEKDFYHINYIQQQNPTHFIENNEVRRKEILSKLLGIDEIENKILTKIEEHINTTKKQYDNLYNDLVEIRREIKKNKVRSIGEQPEYIRLFEHEEFKWDLQNYIINEYDLNELNKIISLKENFIIFKKQFINDKIHDILEKNEVEKLLIYLKNKENFEKIKCNRQLKNRINDEVLKKLNFNFIAESKEEDILKWKGILDDQTLEHLIQLRKRIIWTIEELNESEKFVNDLNSLRNTLNENIQLWKKISGEDNKCPLCGQFYGDFYELKNKIEKYVKKEDNINIKFHQLSSKIDRKRKRLTKELNILVDKIIHYKNNLFVLEDEEFILLEKIMKEGLHEKYENIKYFIENDLHIFLDEFIKNDVNKNNVNLLSNKIKKSMFKIEKDKSLKDYSILLQTFKRYFKNNLSLLEQIDINEMLMKKVYLDWCYNNYLYEQWNKDKQKFNKKLNEIIRVKYKLEELDKMKKIFNKNVGIYKTLMISNIEIPLYIYTGKIMQTHQKGLGVFCYLGEKKDDISRLKFISSLDTYHDIINTFSSGQLSAFILSFTLAINKVYNKNFSSILIDDPIQTMDEINIVSFTEILRNEFSDKQIIMSTHEDNIAGYILYKYKKYNINADYINVKDYLYSQHSKSFTE